MFCVKGSNNYYGINMFLDIYDQNLKRMEKKHGKITAQTAQNGKFKKKGSADFSGIRT